MGKFSHSPPLPSSFFLTSVTSVERIRCRTSFVSQLSSIAQSETISSPPVSINRRMRVWERAAGIWLAHRNFIARRQLNDVMNVRAHVHSIFEPPFKTVDRHFRLVKIQIYFFRPDADHNRVACDTTPHIRLLNDYFQIG